MRNPEKVLAKRPVLEPLPSTPRSLFAREVPGDLEPDARLAVRDVGGDTLARCSLWWRRTPRCQGRTVGYIGHYAARDPESAARLLSTACKRLAGCGRMLAVGPVDGSTWSNYRYVVDTGSEPPFFLEPRNPPESPDQFRIAGFEPLAFYRSSIQENLSTEDKRLMRASARLNGIGVRIRTLDSQRIDEELRRIYELSLESFAHGLLFSPITVDSFIARYRPLLPLIDPELVTVAEHRGRMVGYLFAMPDVLQVKRRETVDTVIVKTIAISPGRRFAGLGHMLAMRGASRARALGYTRAIHALMHERNGSANWSARLGRPIRRYALFSRTLDDFH